jgi:hypothetical protein
MIYTSSFHAGPGDISDLRRLENKDYEAVLVTPTESPDSMIKSLAGTHYGYMIYTSVHNSESRNYLEVHGVGMIREDNLNYYKSSIQHKLLSYHSRRIPYLYNVSPSCTVEEREFAKLIGCQEESNSPFVINGRLGRVLISHNRIRFWWQSSAKYVFVCAGGVGKSDFSHGLRGETSGVRAYVIVSDYNAGGNYVYNNKYNNIMLGFTSFPTVHRLREANEPVKQDEPVKHDNEK